MKTEDAERIVRLLADSLEQGKEFALAQAPDVVQQLVLLERTVHTAMACLLIAVATGRRQCTCL
jgi:hypothetical protein